MIGFLQLLGITVIGVMLLWFGYTLFFSSKTARKVESGKGKRRKRKFKGVESGYPGAARTCPVCSAVLLKGEQVKSAAFPGIPGQGRMMHISGCVFCLEGDRRRVCPVCGKVLEDEQFLVARMFDRPGRSHVHVLGCSQCRGFRS